uniref:Uncharacterized protein n=1 Tax=Anopheles dirus TaxID=7168 RepID=A0A182NH75_9DIPT
MEPTPGGDGHFSSLDELQRKLNEDFAQTLGPMTSPQHIAATSTSSGAAAASSSGVSATIATTISTIVLQGGPLQLVVAILKFAMKITQYFPPESKSSKT